MVTLGVRKVLKEMITRSVNQSGVGKLAMYGEKGTILKERADSPALATITKEGKEVPSPTIAKEAIQSIKTGKDKLQWDVLSI